MKKFILAFIVIIVIVSLMGCASFNRMVKNNELVSQLAWEAATGRVLYEHPEWTSRTVAITDALLVLIDSKSMTSIDGVMPYVMDRVPWQKLQPEEQAALSAILSEGQRELRAMVSTKNITGSDQEMVGVRQVIVWINETAKRPRAVK